jgi:hypothetical protein
MYTAIQDYVLQHLPFRKKSSQSGWISFDAPCCVYRGESADTRSRGGIKTTPEGGVSYHCFNCSYTASYQPGRSLSYKFRRLLKWLGTDELEIQRLAIEATRYRSLIDPGTLAEPEETREITFDARQIPEQARDVVELATYYSLANYDNIPEDYHNVLTYIVDTRKIDSTKYQFLWTPEVASNLHKRVIVPFYYKGNVVGSTARAVVDGVRPKYYSNHPADFVFNLDQQTQDKKFVIVCEGPFDAMSIDGVAVLTNEISKQQVELIESLDREIIVVPDFDVKPHPKSGKNIWAGQKLVNQALELGWTVSFPVWRETCKDINEAAVKYGQLFVLKAVLEACETSRIKIELLKRGVIQ